MKKLLIILFAFPVLLFAQDQSTEKELISRCTDTETLQALSDKFCASYLIGMKCVFDIEYSCDSSEITLTKMYGNDKAIFYFFEFTLDVESGNISVWDVMDSEYYGNLAEWDNLAINSVTHDIKE